MPAPIIYAHRLMQRQTQLRKQGNRYSVAVETGGGLVSSWGVGAGSVPDSCTRSMLGLGDNCVVLFRNKEVARVSTSKVMTSPQVSCSSKSLVFLTPISWVALVSPQGLPRPSFLAFCPSTAKMSRPAVIRMRTTRKVNILALALEFFDKGGKIPPFFREFQDEFIVNLQGAL